MKEAGRGRKEAEPGQSQARPCREWLRSDPLGCSGMLRVTFFFLIFIDLFVGGRGRRREANSPLSAEPHKTGGSNP